MSTTRTITKDSIWQENIKWPKKASICLDGGQKLATNKLKQTKIPSPSWVMQGHCGCRWNISSLTESRLHETFLHPFSPTSSSSSVFPEPLLGRGVEESSSLFACSLSALILKGSFSPKDIAAHVAETSFCFCFHCSGFNDPACESCSLEKMFQAESFLGFFATALLIRSCFACADSRGCLCFWSSFQDKMQDSGRWFDIWYDWWYSIQIYRM